MRRGVTRRRASASPAACPPTAACAPSSRTAARGVRCRHSSRVSPLSTDNAAMIAAAGLRKFRAGATASMDLNADRRAGAMIVVTDYLVFNTQEAAGVRPHHGRDRRDRETRAASGRHRARVGDAHHVRRVRQRLGRRADSRLSRRGSKSSRRPVSTIAIIRRAKTTPTRI